MKDDVLPLVLILAAAGFAAYEIDETLNSPGVYIAGGALALLAFL
jgi:hypothetical protein